MDHIKALAFLALSIAIWLNLYAPLSLSQEPVSIRVSLENEPWSKWLIPTNPITLSGSGDVRFGSAKDVSFASNNADGFYLVGFMGNGGHLVNEENGAKLKNPLEIKFPGMPTQEPMMDDSFDGYPDYGYAYFEYSPGYYEGNIDFIQKISEEDPKGVYSGTLSIALTYTLNAISN